MQTARDPWWAFPALGKVLKGKPPAAPEVGWTSVSDTVYEQLRRLVEVADQAELYKTIYFRRCAKTLNSERK